jgi:hypothetical protein
VIFFHRVWIAAARTFGKRTGHGSTLQPYSDTWKLVIQRAEHALRVWNAKYGPLSAEQWEYAGELVEYALEHAIEAPGPNERYAWFNAKLTMLLNHESVDAGFRRREDDFHKPVADLPVLTGIGA